MPEPIDDIVLQNAYSFVCSNCSHRQFGEMVTAELTPDQEASIKRKLGIEEWDDDAATQGVEMVTTPTYVTCDECGTKFKVWIDPELVADDE